MILVAILTFLQSIIKYILLKYAVFTKFGFRRVTHRSLNNPRSGSTRRAEGPKGLDRGAATYTSEYCNIGSFDLEALT